MQIIDPTEINGTISSGESIVVFFVPAGQKRLHVPIVEADENGNLSLVTILVSGTKYLHRTTPGKHLYLLSTVGERSEMLEANLEAEKTYYTYVSQYPDSPDTSSRLFYAFQFLPVPRVTDEQFTKDLALCRWFQNSETAKNWFERNHPNLQKRFIEAQTRHSEASSNKKISLEYGTTIPVR